MHPRCILDAFQIHSRSGLQELYGSHSCLCQSLDIRTYILLLLASPSSILLQLIQPRTSLTILNSVFFMTSLHCLLNCYMIVWVHSFCCSLWETWNVKTLVPFHEPLCEMILVLTLRSQTLTLAQWKQSYICRDWCVTTQSKYSSKPLHEVLWKTHSLQIWNHYEDQDQCLTITLQPAHSWLPISSRCCLPYNA